MIYRMTHSPLVSCLQQQTIGSIRKQLVATELVVHTPSNELTYVAVGLYFGYPTSRPNAVYCRTTRSL